MVRKTGLKMLIMATITIGLLLNGVGEVKAESGVTVLRSASVRANTWAEIGAIRIEAEPYALKNDDSMLLQLPEDFKFYGDNYSVSGPVISGSPAIITYTLTGDQSGQARIVIPENYAGEANDLFASNAKNPLEITPLNQNEIRIKLLNYLSTGGRNVVYVYFDEIFVPNGYSGGISLQMDAQPGSGWPVNKAVVADTGRSLPGEPRDLKAQVAEAHSVALIWEDNSGIEDGFIIWSQKTGGNYEKLALTEPDIEKYVISGLEPDTEYRFKLTAYNGNGESDYSNEIIVKTAAIKEMQLKLNQRVYSINGQDNIMEAAPVVINDRVFLPLRAIAEGLGADVEWYELPRKATVKMDEKVIELTLDSNQAMINGQKTLIDAGDPAVKPVLAADRILLPLRFIAEGLDKEINWDPSEQLITVRIN
ncbi:MAG: stalk domain-containing protein [Syntrophomonadaceae bacterium]|nr:stalk domain-containing protein [Syntrophomonadaceae bacterium]